MKFVLPLVFVLTAFLPVVYAQNSTVTNDRNSWIAGIIKETSAIKPGMTRADLMKVFEQEGGLSTGLRRTYVSHQCPYIKVDVEFEAVGRPDRDQEGRVTSIEDERDLIKRISKPYLDWAIAD
jgi:hypothetical protein